jgi:restriction endonuclease S subunit
MSCNHDNHKENWEFVELGSIVSISKGQGLSKSDIVDNGKHGCILYGELFTKYGRVVRKITNTTNSEEGILSKSGDILIPGSTTTTGEDLATASAILVDGVRLGGDINILRPNLEKVNPEYLAHYITGRKKQEIKSAAQGITIYHLYGRELAPLKIGLPPLEEQQAIAEVLSDADAYVESLDALIEKKKNIKQAVMQELLTGKTRLQGFDDEWIWLPLGDVVSHKAGNGSLIKGKLFSSPAQGKAKGFSASGQDVWCDEAEYGGDGLVVSAVGSRCGKVFRASGEWTAIANTHVLLPKKGKCDADFIWFIINDEDFWKKGGSGQPFVLMKDSLNQKIKIPAFEEQQAIAEILSDIDAEIDALIAQRDKAELIKQGMMQELLSGRTRLV